MLDSKTVWMIIEGLRDSLYMVVVSTTIAYAIGLPIGILLTISDEDGIKPCKPLYRVLDFIVNIGRSIPFIILFILLIPVARFLVGKSYGTNATIVALVFSAVPYIGRVVEASLKEVDKGVIEAAQSLGASDFEIITHVLIPEAKTSLLAGATITLGNIFGYSAMAGSVGGGGLGDIAIRYGYYRYETDIMITTVLIIIILMQLFQFTGNLIASKTDKRKR